MTQARVSARPLARHKTTAGSRPGGRHVHLRGAERSAAATRRPLHTGIFANLLTVAGLPHMRLYDLRHSSLSILADEGIDPKVIQERAGHANIKTTYDKTTFTRTRRGRRWQRPHSIAHSALAGHDNWCVFGA